MVANKTQYVFGPAPSRRLGRSLGLDLAPRKTCTYDCIYCQLGRTTNRTLDRGPYVSIDAVLRELAQTLRATPAVDYITLSGSGEPTLQVGLGALIKGIRRLTDLPIAVLTNGALLWRADVQTELMEADLLIPSLDAGDEEMFQRVNRPHPHLRLHQVVDGIASFGRRFRGRVWLEAFLLSGLTTTESQLARMRALIEHIAPDRVQINTVARPPSEIGASAATGEALLQAAKQLGAHAEVIADAAPAEAGAGARPLDANQILALLRRRPCTLDDLSAGLATHPLEMAKEMETLERSGRVRVRRHDARTFYQLA